MGRKNYMPGSNRTDRRLPMFSQDSFASGLIKDFPASEIPDNAIARGSNVVVYPNEIQGRLGSQLYTSNELPPLRGRTGYGATKDGYIITADTNMFTEDDIGNYWVWPGTETTHEEIIRYIDGLHVEVATSDTRAFTAGCYMRGKVNFWHFHSVLRKWLLLLGTELWVVDITMATWTRIQTISKLFLFNAVTKVEEFDDYSWIVFNSNGHYHVSSYWEKYFAWQRNIAIPNIQIPIVEANAKTYYGYNYLYSAARLSEMGNFIDRLSPSRIELETGTNKWDENGGDFSEINTTLPISSGDSMVIGPLYVPQVKNTFPVEYERHLTHFPVYRTLDIKNVYQSGQNIAALNDPQRFIWVKDLRICGAFFARKFNGHVLALYGQFEPADVGSTLEWENGDRDTILSYIKEDEVTIAKNAYYGEETDYMACAIGNGRVFRASQTGTTVTRTHGDVFSADDVGTTLVSSTGYYSVIEEFVDANTVTVHDDQDKVAQGFTCQPTHRYFCDTTSDEILKNRIGVIECRCRFMEPMPNVNDGIIVPGFMITARRGEKELYYCAWEVFYEYLASFYYAAYQYSTDIKNPIQRLLKHPGRFSALCQDYRTWFGPTNATQTTILQEINAVIPRLSGIDILEGGVGCFDYGSIQEIDRGLYVLLTKEQSGVGLRTFNGFSFSDNQLEIPKLGHTTVMRDLEKWQKATASIYDAIAGYIVWGREKE
jgi:hypothetical protein